MRASLGPPTDRSLHMTVRVTDELSTRPRATQTGFQDDESFKNTFLETSPRSATLTAAPSPSCGTCASGDVVLFAAAAPHQPSRSAASALKSMPCGTRRCGRRGSEPGRAAWVRYLWAAAGFRRAGSAARRSGKPGGGSALGRRTGTKQTNKQAHKQTQKPALLFLAAPALVRQRPSGSARGHDKRHAHRPANRHNTQTHARKQTNTHTRLRTRKHTHTRTLSHSHLHTHPPHANKHTHAHAHTARTRRCRRCTPTPCRTARAGCSRDARTHALTHARTLAVGPSALDASCTCLGVAMHRMRM
jgi:hypothetical protein